MRLRKFLLVASLCALLASGLPAGSGVRGQQQQPAGAQIEGTLAQRLEVVRQRLETTRRTLNGAIAGLNAGDDKQKKDKDKKVTDDPVSRLRGLEKDAGSLLNEVAELRAKIERGEKAETSEVERLESAFAELNGRIDAGLQATAGARREATVASGGTAAAASKNKKKPGFFGRILGRGDDGGEYDELVGGIAPGRDRQLFEEAAKLARKSRYETARYLFNVIITTYPDSPYLPHAKLAIADTFYLEGTTSALIQAANSYREWQTFFPTDPLADEVMLKVAEVEMRQMGLPDRDVAHARKAEQLLKALLQQYPNTALRPDAQVRLSEVQENLGMHTFQVGNFYMDRYERGVAPNPKGAQSRYREVVEKYPNFSRRDRALYLLANTYVLEEEPDEAAKYFQEIVRNFPNSEYAEKAQEQLDAIGAPKPQADPKALSKLPPEKRSMTSRFFQQMFGTPTVTVDKNGVLINKDSNESSLIDVVIENKGTLPVTTPNAPTITRRVSSAAPAPRAQPTPTPAADKPASGVQLTPANPGAPATVDTPSAPPAQQRPPAN
jgi:outer membrane protein assembly factor BamD